MTFGLNELDALDVWRLCDQLSITQAALLIIGEDPSGGNEYIENWDRDKQPSGYKAAKTAIINGIKSQKLTGKAVYEPETDMNGNFIDWTDTIDLEKSIVDVESLKAFLSRKGITSGFFFNGDDQKPHYLDKENENYSNTLAAAIEAWQAISQSPDLQRGTTVKQAIMKWLRVNASKYDLVNEGELLTDKEVREAADNLLGLCNKIVDIEMKK